MANGIEYKGKNMAVIKGQKYTLNAAVLKAWGISQEVISAGLSAKKDWNDVLEDWRTAGNEIPAAILNPPTTAVNPPQNGTTTTAKPNPPVQNGTLVRPASVSESIWAIASDAMKAELVKLSAENDMLRASRNQITMKVSDKGALSVYGMGRFPITLYREQWEKLLGMADAIRKFIADNGATLKTKEERKG